MNEEEVIFGKKLRPLILGEGTVELPRDMDIPVYEHRKQPFLEFLYILFGAGLGRVLYDRTHDLALAGTIGVHPAVLQSHLVADFHAVFQSVNFENSRTPPTQWVRTDVR